MIKKIDGILDKLNHFLILQIVLKFWTSLPSAAASFRTPCEGGCWEPFGG